ncbi:amidohydrolase family protein [Aldersonia kunmingensis]|uniref:amidohydrolase family protein n=1 Tax=Aldersonia kunmingensis TaxID=408066 RepID=UPI00082A25A2|nr:amidohydrolase family protein [Aldersonia kunmingensis]
MTTLLFRNAEVDGELVDVRVEGHMVTAVGPGLSNAGAELIDAGGGALLPGLHDHHLHLLAIAAARRSIDCGSAAVRDEAGLRAALAVPGTGWLRGTNYHESVAGELDRTVLDRWVPDRPVRIQHRSGALWMLNSAAVKKVSHVLDGSIDVERDGAGQPTGRLWRYDDRLRAALVDDPPDLGPVGADLTGFGITGVTDATPDIDSTAIELIAAARESGTLPQRVVLLGAATDARLPAGIEAGPYKLLLRDHDLPSYDELAARVATSHDAHRPVAVHCVSRESLLLTLAVLADIGAVDGDRIEHAGVVPPGVGEQMAELGVRVVTQPGFLRERGDAYARDVAEDDLPHLYPHAGLLADGVSVAVSSDAPFGPLDPWQVIAAAVERRSAAGVVLGEAERVSAATALAGYLAPPDDPGGPPRRIVPGAAADLCLLHAPVRTALASLDRSLVRTVVIDGVAHVGEHPANQ